jgi:hypothetical protein
LAEYPPEQLQVLKANLREKERNYKATGYKMRRHLDAFLFLVNKRGKLYHMDRQASTFTYSLNSQGK